MIPAGWNEVSLRRIGTSRAGSGFPPALQGNTEEELAFYKVNHLGKASADGVLREPDDTVSPTTADRLRAEVFPPGSIVYAKIGAALLLGRIRILDRKSCIDNNMSAFVSYGSVDSRYLYYAMSTINFGRIVNPGAVPSLSDKKFLDTKLLVPDASLQVQISAYLDRETQKIDELITEQRSLIEILKERREALIEQIVPLGLSDASLTESSVPWISRMPSHWNVARMKHDTEMATGGTPDTDDLTYWTEPSDELGVPWVAISDMSQRKSVGNTAKRLTLAGIASKRLAIGEEGTILFAMYASVGEVSRLDISATWNQAILGITPGVKFDSQYLAYSLMAMRRFMLGEVRTNTQANLSARQVGDMWLPCPPRGEQREIANYLDDQTSRIDELISESEDLIALSQERRAALITAAVTGQIDVRRPS